MKYIRYLIKFKKCLIYSIRYFITYVNKYVISYWSCYSFEVCHIGRGGRIGPEASLITARLRPKARDDYKRFERGSIWTKFLTFKSA